MKHGFKSRSSRLSTEHGCFFRLCMAALQLSEHLEEQSFGTMKNKYLDLEINLPVDILYYIIYVSFLILLPRFGALCKRTYIN